LASLTAKATAAGFDPGPSAPIYLVMLVDESIDEENAEQIEEDIEAGLAFQFFEEAVGYVETNIAVPEPTSLTMALAGIGLLLCRGRRQG